MAVIMRPRPEQVRKAVALLYLAVAIGFAKALVPYGHSANQVYASYDYAISAGIFALLAFLARKILGGSNRARIGYFVFFVVGVLLSAPFFVVEFPSLPAEDVYRIAQFAIQLAAVWLLLTRPAKSWFIDGRKRL
jgi:hypothetical protein